MKGLLAAFVVGVVTAAPAFAQCSDAEKRKLEEFDRAWTDATNKGDRAQLQSIYADDYASAGYVTSLVKATTIDDAVRTAERNRANPQAVPRTNQDHYVITCTPVAATVTHRNVVTTTVNGREQTSYSRSVHVMEKRGGRWQVVSNVGHAIPDAGMVAYLEEEWNEAAKRRDVAWFEKNFADDATEVSSRTAVLETKAEAIASMKADKLVYDALELSELSTRVEGNAAVVTGVNRVRGRDAQGKAFDRRVRFTDTFIKRDGRWLVWASQGTTIP